MDCWRVFLVLSDQALSYYGDDKTCKSKLLLCSCVDYIVLFPIDGLCSDALAHVSYQDLTIWHFAEWEVNELKAIFRFIVTVMEELGPLSYIPLS